MDIINKKFSSGIKMLIILAVILIFIRILPILVIVVIAALGIFKVVKYLKGIRFSKMEFFKGTKKEDKCNTENNFDLKNKKVVDVQYEDISSNKESENR